MAMPWPPIHLVMECITMSAPSSIGRLRYGGAEAVVIARLDEGRGDAEARQGVGEQIDGAAVERGGRDDVVAGAEQRGDGEMHRGHAARGAHRADARLERREPLLQHGRRRVGDAGVDVSGALQVEQGGGVVRILEHERGGLIDRRGARAGDGIGMLAGVQAQRFEPRGFRWRHAFPREDLLMVRRSGPATPHLMRGSAEPESMNTGLATIDERWWSWVPALALRARPE